MTLFTLVKIPNNHIQAMWDGMIDKLDMNSAYNRVMLKSARL